MMLFAVYTLLVSDILCESDYERLTEFETSNTVWHDYCDGLAPSVCAKNIYLYRCLELV